MKINRIVCCLCFFFVFELKAQDTYIHPMNFEQDGMSNPYVILGDTSQVRSLIVGCSKAPEKLFDFMVRLS